MTGVLLLPAGTEREEWLAARANGIGASEIATVLGLSPWDSPFSLYWRKRLGTQTDMNEAMEWGLRHEPAIAAKFAENHPELHLTPGGLYRHPDHEWMLATPDRLLYDGPPHDVEERDGVFHPLDREPVAVLQIKTGYSLDEWGEPGTDQIPLHYRAQVMQEMAVVGVTRAHLAVLVKGNTYREYVVDFDAEDAATFTKAGTEFMRCLADGTPPDLDGAATTTATLKQLHPSVVDEAVTIPIALADQYRIRRELLDDAQAAYDETCNRIRAAIGDNRLAVAGGRKVAQRSVYDTTRVDSKRLKAEQPDLYAEYSATSTTDKLVPCKETP